MFSELFDQYINQCIERLENYKDESLQADLAFIKKMMGENYYNELRQIVYVFTMDNFRYPESYEEEIEMIKDIVHGIVQHFKNTSYTYVFKVMVEGQENNVWRLLQMPARCSLADLAYAIMGCMNCDGSHLYNMTYKREVFSCGTTHNKRELNANETMLWELNLKKRSKIMMNYDFGESYRFIIQVSDIRKVEENLFFENIQVLDGKGYGILEDNHYVFDAYYAGDMEPVHQYLSDYDFEMDEFDLAEPFDIEECNETMLFAMPIFYSNYEDMDNEFDFDVDDDLPFA